MAWEGVGVSKLEKGAFFGLFAGVRGMNGSTPFSVFFEFISEMWSRTVKGEISNF